MFSSKQLVMIIGAALLGLVGILGWLFSIGREASSRSVCVAKFSGLSHAMHRYMEVNQSFPPAYVLGPDGRPWHSWRILLLPYMDMSERALYEEYRFDEPWDGPNNSKLAARMPWVFGCPADRENAAKGFTNYFVVTGPDTVFSSELVSAPDFGATQGMRFKDHEESNRFQFKFRRSRTRSFSSIPKPAETILLVESVGREINWLEPRDIPFAEMADPAATITSRHKVALVAMVNAKVIHTSQYDAETLRRMCLVDPDKPPEKNADSKRLSE